MTQPTWGFGAGKPLAESSTALLMNRSALLFISTEVRFLMRLQAGLDQVFKVPARLLLESCPGASDHQYRAYGRTHKAKHIDHEVAAKEDRVVPERHFVGGLR